MDLELFTVPELTMFANGKVVNKVKGSICNVSIDSRNIKKGSLFIPLRGENVDGHRYINNAFKNGAAASLEHPMPRSQRCC